MIKKVIILLLCLSFPFLNGCTPQKSSPFSAESLESAASKELKASVLDDRRYLKMNIVTKKDNMLYGKHVMPFSELQSDSSLKKFNVDSIGDDWIWNFNNDREILFCSGPKDSMIAVHSLKNDQCTPLIHLEDGHVAGFKAINKDYLLWTESSSDMWKDTTLHIYDLNTKKDKVFYTYTVNPQSGCIYAMNSNECVIWNQTVYFDDIVGIDSNGNYQINLYAYKISDGSIALIKKQAQNPFIYQNSLCWFEYDEDTGNPVMVLNDKKSPKKYLIHNGTSIFHSNGDTISVTDELTMPDTEKLFDPNQASSNIYSDKEKKTVDGLGFTLLNETSVIPLLVTKGLSMGPAVSNSKAVVWSRIEGSVPMFYDISSQNFVVMDTLPKGDYSCIMNDNELLFINEKTAYLLTLS